MNNPTSDQFYAALDATWPAATFRTVGPWTIREGLGGGSRVSAATGGTATDINLAEKAMKGLKQRPLFMIRKNDTNLDQELEARGYKLFDPVTLYSGDIDDLAMRSVPHLAGFPVWPSLAIMDEIWDNGGIDANRLAIMQRVVAPKTALLGRALERAAGTGFVAIHGDIAMIHAIEVAPALRRNGVANNILLTAAKWARENQARKLCLAVTNSNTAANALYVKLGLSVVGHYHYRKDNDKDQGVI